MRKSQFSEEQIIGILKLVEAGQQVGEVWHQRRHLLSPEGAVRRPRRQ